MRRSVFVLAVLLAAVLLPSAAQPVLRAPPPNDNAASATSIVIPGVFLVAGTMDESTVEVGEPAHQCTAGGPTVGAGSVWYLIKLPAGRLTVNTAQSEFDTAVTLYHRPAGPINLPALQAVDCADSGPLGSLQARLKTKIAAGEYLVQISRIPPSLLGSDDLRAAFDFKPDVRPKGDSITAPIPLTIGKVAKSAHVEGALGEAFENAPSCDIGGVVSSVWFRLDVPFGGTLRLSGEGTVISSTTGVDDRATMTVYRGSNFITMTEVECSDDAADNLPFVAVNAGDTLWVRMTVNFPTNLFRPGTYKVSAIYDGASLLANPGFEADLAGWKLKKAANGDGITTIGGEVISGTRSFKFVGGPGEATKLKQNVAIPENLRLRNTELTPVLQFNILGPAQSIDWTLILFPRDGSPAVKLTYHVDANGAGSSSIETFVQVEKVRKITLQFINKNTSGSFVLDNVDIQLAQFSVLRRPAVLPPLPLPPAPMR